MLNLKGKAGSLHTISGQSEFKNIFTFCTLDITEKISELPELGQAYIYHHPGMVWLIWTFWTNGIGHFIDVNNKRPSNTPIECHEIITRGKS